MKKAFEVGVVRGAVAKHLDKRLGGKHASAYGVAVELLRCRHSPQHGLRLRQSFGCPRHRKNRPHQVFRGVRL